MKNILAFLTLILLTLNSFAQSTIITYFDESGNKTDSINAIEYQKLIYPTAARDSHTIENYTIDGRFTSYENYITIKTKPTYPFDKKTFLDGEFKEFYKNGTLKILKNYSKNKLHDKVQTYFENGSIKRDDTFKDGKLVSGKCYDINGNDIEHFDFMIKPQYKGGYKAIGVFISDNIKYPKKLQSRGVSGKVYVKFKVMKNGEIKNIRAVQYPHKDLGDEAVRVVKLLKDWIPGKVDGEIKNFSFMLPISFNLD